MGLILLIKVQITWKPSGLLAGTWVWIEQSGFRPLSGILCYVFEIGTTLSLYSHPGERRLK